MTQFATFLDTHLSPWCRGWGSLRVGVRCGTGFGPSTQRQASKVPRSDHTLSNCVASPKRCSAAWYRLSCSCALPQRFLATCGQLCGATCGQSGGGLALAMASLCKSWSSKVTKGTLSCKSAFGRQWFAWCLWTHRPFVLVPL